MGTLGLHRAAVGVPWAGTAIFYKLWLAVEQVAATECGELVAATQQIAVLSGGWGWPHQGFNYILALGRSTIRIPRVRGDEGADGTVIQ